MGRGVFKRTLPIPYGKDGITEIKGVGRKNRRLKKETRVGGLSAGKGVT